MENLRVVTDIEKIREILDRGTIVDILPSRDKFESALASGKKLRFYIGFDATAPTLHLSHAKNLQLLEKFRKLGHEVIVLFGDFTARIGDPSEESAARKPLTAEEVMNNVKIWKELIRPLMDFDTKDNPPIIKFNSVWLEKMTMGDILELSSCISVQQLIQRSMFQERLAKDKPLYLHEFLYPVMQGYDSLAMDVDVEVCGTDQLFNAKVGRDFQNKLNNGREKFIVQVTLMEDPKTAVLMSKSKNIGVFLDATPIDMYGQTMSQSDEMIKILFVNCTDIPLEEIDRITNVGNPMEAKLHLSYEITKTFHGEDEAKIAAEHFKKTVQKQEIPEDIKTVEVDKDEISVQDALIASGFEGSNADIRRLVQQGAVKVDGSLVEDCFHVLKISSEGLTFKAGKRFWFKIKHNN